MKLKEFYNQLMENGIRVPLIRDPKTKLPSISYTLVIVSFIYSLVAIALNIADMTTNTGASMELFYATAALYFGRALSIKGQTYSATNEEKKEE